MNGNSEKNVCGVAALEQHITFAASRSIQCRKQQRAR